MSVFDKLFSMMPKKSEIVFSSFPDYSDNAYALYCYIVTQRDDIASKYQMTWLASGNAPLPSNFPMHSNTRLLRKKSISGFFAAAYASYVFHTHGYYSGRITAPVQGSTIVNLWHGCGYKGIPEADRVGYYGDYNIVTSEVYRKIHSRIFSVQEWNILAFGLPRNDVLFTRSDARELLGIKSSDRLYIWMPTYRKASFGHSGDDGLVDSFGIGSLSVDDLRAIDESLKLKRGILLIKPHPMDSVTSIKECELTNIRVITNEDLSLRGVGLYHLLACSDVLLSDYSSVIIDYLLLDKPIVLTISDMEEYSASRGFVFDNVSHYLPGPIASSPEELVRYFIQPEALEEKWAAKRKELTTVFHEHIDGNSCERICDYFFGKNG